MKKSCLDALLLALLVLASGCSNGREDRLPPKAQVTFQSAAGGACKTFHDAVRPHVAGLRDPATLAAALGAIEPAAIEQSAALRAIAPGVEHSRKYRELLREHDYRDHLFRSLRTQLATNGNAPLRLARQLWREHQARYRRAAGPMGLTACVEAENALDFGG